MARRTRHSRKKALSIRPGVPAILLGLLALLALPAVGLATVALQVTDEPPRSLNQHDAATIGARLAPGAANIGPTFDPYAAPGVPLARGTNAQPAGPLRLVTYLLEEVTLPARVPIPALETRPNGSTILRLSVLGGPFAVRSSQPVVWIDDVPLAQTAFSTGLDRVSALITDRSVVRNGAVIAVSYGAAANERQRVPEPLVLGPGSP